jgi:hypothetical protein
MPSRATEETAMPPVHGSCLCGGVKFEIAGSLLAQRRGGASFSRTNPHEVLEQKSVQPNATSF